MTSSVLKLLKCPVCGAKGESVSDGRVFACTGAKRHTFDFAKSGYLNLCLTSKEGDSKDAVRSRSEFLEAGYYQCLSNEVNAILDSIGANSVLDAGCGEGYYTNRMANGRIVLGADLSRAGIDHAAKSAKRMESGAAFVVASLFEVPTADASFDAVTNLFAPCAEEEFLRVLKPNGRLILVGAGERHLMGLKKAIYDTPYLNEGRRDLPKNMRFMEKRSLRQTITVEGNDAVNALFSMTPYYWRTSEHDRAKLVGIERLETEIDFDIFLYGKDS